MRENRTYGSVRGICNISTRLIATIFLLLTLIPQCLADTNFDAINNQMQVWVGHSRDELIASFGAPQQTMDDGRGGVIYVYIENLPVPSDLLLPGAPIPQRQRIFWINNKGIIYNWSWKGL